MMKMNVNSPRNGIAPNPEGTWMRGYKDRRIKNTYLWKAQNFAKIRGDVVSSMPKDELSSVGQSTTLPSEK